MTCTLLAMLIVYHFSTNDKPFNTNILSKIALLNFCIGIIKIIIYFHYGEEVSNSFKRLKNKLEEFCSTNQLSNDEWKHWVDIKDMESQFDLTIFKVLKLRRDYLIAIGAFVLQYSVILIQTND